MVGLMNYMDKAIGQFHSNNTKDYIIARVKKVIAFCVTKEHLLVAINYAALASVEIVGADNEEANDWLDYFRPIIFDRVSEIKIAGGSRWDLATKWVKRRYN